MSGGRFRTALMLAFGIAGVLADTLAHAQAGGDDSGELMRQLMASAAQARALAEQGVGQDAQGCDYRRRAIEEFRNSSGIARKLATMGQEGMRDMASQIDARVTADTRDYEIMCRQQTAVLAAPDSSSTGQSQDDALAQIRALDAQVMKALKTAQFHIKAAIKEDAWASANDDASAQQNAAGRAYQPVGSGSHWAACMDARDARKSSDQVLLWLEQEEAIAARANISLPDAAEQAKAARHAQEWVDKFC